MFPCLVQAQPGRYLLRVYAKPGARASAFAAPLTPSLTEADLRIAAAPVEGQANAELLRYLDELVERGFRSMTEDHTEYVKDTCYAQVLAADATTTAASTQSAKSSSGGDRISTKKGRSKNAVATSCASLRLRSGAGDSQQPTGSTAPPSEAVFPDRIEVSLVRGGTSREKTLLVVFPGTRAQLAAILEKESQE